MISENICPVAHFNKILGGKWKLIIINTLRNKGEIRFVKLAFFIPAISRKVLSDQLKELERDGLVIRTQYAEIPPRVEYALTEASKNLCSVFNEIETWSNNFMP